jgi:hypothetical protein
MAEDNPDKARIHTMKNIAACIFGLFLVCCGATLPPPTNLAVLIALTAPTPTMISESEPTKKKGSAK